jgi:hypothetical protein
MLDTGRRFSKTLGDFVLTMGRIGVEEDLCLVDAVLWDSNNVSVSAALAATAQRSEGAHG